MNTHLLNIEPLVYTRDEFCKAHKISRSTFDRMIRAGRGPAIIKMVGKKGKVLITKESAAKWRKNMER